MLRHSLVLIFIFAASALAAGEPPAIVSHVKVVSDKAEDVSTLEAWKKTYIKDGMSDQEKAIAIWKTVVKYRHQVTPVNEDLQFEGNVHDPMKTIHVYGYGICCCASSNVMGLARYLGLPARGRCVHNHSVPEIFYDNSWHLFDASLIDYFTKKDGKVASVDEIRATVADFLAANPGFSHNDKKLRDFAKNGGWKKGPELMATCPTYDNNGINCAGWHGWPTTMDEFDLKDSIVYEYGPSMGYEVNIQLRAGEKLQRNWGNKGLYLNMPDQNPGVMDNRKGMDTQKEFGDRAPARVGNGTLVYNVPLASGAFRGGALSVENLACSADDKASPAVHVKDAGKPAVLIIRMPCSYVYLSGELAVKTVVGSGGSVSVSISDNNGLDWKPVAKFEKAGDEKLDLKPFCYRKYDYRLKFEFSGAGTGLDALKIAHDIQHSQAPLPIIIDGDNKISFSAGAQEGTISLEPMMNPDNATKAKQNSYLDYHPVVNGLGKVYLAGTGDATFTVNTPGEMTRLRMNCHWRARDANEFYDILVSFDGGKTFKAVDKLTGPFAGCTKYITIGDVPAKTQQAQVKFVGNQKVNTCLFDLRIDADYKEPRGGFRPVKITYAWEEDGKPKSDVHIAKTATEEYHINCGAKTVAKSVTLELAE